MLLEKLNRFSIQSAFSKGRKIFFSYLICFFKKNEDEKFSFAVSVSKKIVKKVDKNKIKRRMRSLIFADKEALKPLPFDVVFIAKKNSFEAPFTSLKADFDASILFFKKQTLKITKKSPKKN